ncbi:VWA domain-containing protein [Ahrensia sp. R2A130]|uniref:vWA domain-containing protein n=1 Tax=Ahrensia sp. R2A130 TaxID=744979 RepID=UPI0001E0C383|nr:VWA domain-containing protein [Ahrensia sp. R2A130]EFL87822.1 VWA containing CoxE family protein [Ahrensia sp. R2A130]
MNALGSAMASTMPSIMPKATRAFVDFAHVLRNNGFAIAPEQTTGFIEAVGLLGPRDINDIHKAGIAMLAIPRARWSIYDALFRAFFLDQAISAPATGDDEDEMQALDPRDTSRDVEVDSDDTEVGAEASRSEALSQREFVGFDSAEVLRHFTRNAPKLLPRRLSYRRRPANRGDRLDMRRALREAVRRDGELLKLPTTRRKTRQRPLVLLVDVSGSMAQQSEPTMRLAHAVVQAADRAEVFTLGTRLTRVTPALRIKETQRALDTVAGLVSDFDGGTRIGDALAALLAVPRFAGALRGAAVVVLSDGLERGEPNTMVDCVARISRMAWRLDWLSPLAADPEFAPRTEALSASQQYLNTLADGSSIAAVAEHILSLARHRQPRPQTQIQSRSAA